MGLDRRVLDRIWSASPEPINLLEDTVDKYYPCYGAILEVAVAPQIVPQGIKVLFPADYPYFADFQPKKRELYEMVTETGEKMSRTLEQLNVKKGMTSSQSHEVYDETTVGVKAGVSTATGIGPTGEVSYQNKSGTKDISQQEQSNVNTTDNSREMRENLSHTTNFTQMYSEFNSYHLGTNRGVFFMLPRPHLVQAEEKTLVTGPRQLEGIQEVFLVVMRPKKIPSIQVKGYLETAHVYKKEETRMPSPKPNEVTFHLDPNTPDAKVLPKEPFGIHWEVHAYGDVTWT